MIQRVSQNPENHGHNPSSKPASPSSLLKKSAQHTTEVAKGAFTWVQGASASGASGAKKRKITPTPTEQTSKIFTVFNEKFPGKLL